jgi:MoxR-like ATPase
VRSTTAGRKVKASKVVSADELRLMQQFVREIPVPDNVIEYAVRLVSRTRPGRDGAPDFVNNYLSYGAGPRASQNLILGAKALAVLDGRLSPVIEDVRRMAVSVLRHRIVSNFNADADSVTPVDIIKRLLQE